MEKIIVVVPKEEFHNIRLLISGMIQRTVDVLLIDPKDFPNYEEIIKKADAELVCTLDDGNIEEKFRKSIEEFNKAFEFKNLPRVLDGVDTKKLFDNTPWYCRFQKEGKRYNHWGNKSRFMKKGKGKLY